MSLEINVKSFFYFKFNEPFVFKPSLKPCHCSHCDVLPTEYANIYISNNSPPYGVRKLWCTKLPSQMNKNTCVFWQSSNFEQVSFKLVNYTRQYPRKKSLQKYFPMRKRPKTIATSGGGAQGSSGDSAFEWQQSQQLSDQVKHLYNYYIILF